MKISINFVKKKSVSEEIADTLKQFVGSIRKSDIQELGRPEKWQRQTCIHWSPVAYLHSTKDSPNEEFSQEDLKIIITFVKENPPDDEIANTLEQISQLISAGYTSGIAQPANVYSWEMK
jgi:hypothetical protein